MRKKLYLSNFLVSSGDGIDVRGNKLTNVKGLIQHTDAANKTTWTHIFYNMKIGGKITFSMPAITV